MSKAAAAEEAVSGIKVDKSKAKALALNFKNEIRGIIQDIRKLIGTINDAVPHISLAIQTSGVRISTTMSPTVSPSRMLQASMFLNTADMQYGMNLQLLFKLDRHLPCHCTCFSPATSTRFRGNLSRKSPRGKKSYIKQK